MLGHFTKIYQYLLLKTAANMPLNGFRHFLFRSAKIKIMPSSFVWPGNRFSVPEMVTIGEHSIVGPECSFLSKGGISIGKHVNISGFSFFITQSHILSDPAFPAVYKPITIDDYCWIGINATILPGVHMAKGAVAGAGSVVTKDVNEFEIVGGNPAKVIGKRAENISYQLCGDRPFYSLWC